MLNKKIKPIITGIILLQGWFFANAQTSPAVNLPKIIPPSPEAASLGKYGDIPVGMFTGHPNVTIPLYEIHTKNLSLPISLNYNVNGIKVNELSSNVGMSWAFNCGGVISRTVYGYPDFVGSDHPMYVPPSNPSFDTNPPDPTTIGWLFSVSTTGLDTQMDAFNFNFNGYSGKFFIVPHGNISNRTYTILTVPYSNVKIQYDFTRTDWNFKITTPDGLIYYFGGQNATELTQSFNSCESGNSGSIPTAWYLTKIEHPYDSSDYLLFSYIPTSYSYESGINKLETLWDGTGTCPQDDPTGACSCGPSAYIYGQATATIPLEQICLSYSTVQTVYLHSITDGKYNQVLLDYVPKTDVSTGGYLLSNLTIKNNQSGQNLKSFHFTYQTAMPGSSRNNPYGDASTKLPRPFLTEVDELDNAGIIVRPYKFSYNDFSQMAPRLSTSQDYWGYYNGQNNGSAFLPMPGSPVDNLLPIANRNPDYGYASMGLLNKVTYPTEGYTSIQYEGNTTNATYTGATDSSNYSPIYTHLQSILVNSSSTSETFTVSTPMTVTITSTVTCNCPSGSGCPIQNDNQVWGQLISNLNTVVQSFDFTKFNNKQNCTSVDITSLTLQPGITYGINITPISPYQLSINIQAQSGSSFNIPDEIIPNMHSTLNSGGGLRVQRILSYDPVTNSTNIKRYFYDPLFAVFPAQPIYYHHISHKELQWFNDGFSCNVVDFPNADAVVQAGYYQFSTNSFMDLYSLSSSPVYYKKVTESLGDNYENGGIEHDYSFNGLLSFSTVLNQFPYMTMAPLMDWRNGLELTTKHFKIANGNQVPVQNETMTYQVDARNSSTISQYVVEKVGNLDPGPSPLGQFSVPDALQIQNYNVAKVDYTSEWQYLSAQTTQDYDVNGNPTVATTTNYYYDNPSHALLTRIQTTDSKNLPIVDYKRYPQDNASISSLTPAETTALSNLVTQGRIGELVEEEKDKNGILAQRIHNSFNSFTNSLVLPQNVQVLNGHSGTSSFTVNTFDNYDSYGDILQMTPRSGLASSYIWDYLNTYPIAEVKNASQSDIAYTSFEADGKGNWTFSGTPDNSGGAITGNQSYSLSSGAISKSGLTSATKYIISYWSKGSVSISGGTQSNSITGKTVNGWTYHEVTVTGTTSVSISGNTYIDELRLYPSDAQMITYTYKPLIGMTSQCDVGNKIQYYEYDTFGRLQDIKDQDGNIIKTFEYHYQSPTQ